MIAVEYAIVTSLAITGLAAAAVGLAEWIPELVEAVARAVARQAVAEIAASGVCSPAEGS